MSLSPPPDPPDSLSRESINENISENINEDISSSSSSTSSTCREAQEVHLPLSVSLSLPPLRPSSWKVYVALFTAQLSWSGFHVLAKGLYDSHLVTNVTLPVFRTTAVLPMLSIWAYYQAGPHFYVVSPRQHVFLALNGLIGNFGVQQLLNLGTLLSSASLAGALQPCIPIITTVMSVALHREEGSWRQAGGVVMSVVGALVIVLWGIGSTDGQQIDATQVTWGAICILLQCLCSSLYIILQKPLLAEQGVHINTFLFYVFLYGGVLHVVLGSFFLPSLPWSNFSLSIIPSILYVSAIASCLAFWTFAFAVKWLPPSISSLGICLQALFSPLLGFIFLGESMTLFGFLGGAMIVGGICVVVYAKEKEKEKAQILLKPNETIILLEPKTQLLTSDHANAFIVNTLQELSCNETSLTSQPSQSASKHLFEKLRFCEDGANSDSNTE